MGVNLLEDGGFWPGVKLMGGHSCVGLNQHRFCQRPLVVLLLSA